MGALRLQPVVSPDATTDELLVVNEKLARLYAELVVKYDDLVRTVESLTIGRAPNGVQAQVVVELTARASALPWAEFGEDVNQVHETGCLRLRSAL